MGKRVLKINGAGSALLLAFILLLPTALLFAQEETIEERLKRLEERGVDLGSERAELERQLEELELQIAKQQEELKKYGTQKKTLQNEIGSLNARVKKLNLEIKAIDVTLEKVTKSITETQRNINRTENKIDLHKDAIAKALRSIQETDEQGFIEIILSHSNFSDFFTSIQNIALVQDRLRLSLQEIAALRENLLRKKRELSIQKEDAENIKYTREKQKKNVELTQSEKAKLLKITKGKESEYQKLIKQTKEAAAKIRNRIFELLGGGELTFEKAYEYAAIAERATGVRAAFILAILNQESRFGRNVGRCKYNDIHPQTGKTVMRLADIPIFEALLEKLGIDKNSQAAYVSCPIVRDGSHGGAMGPAQFIPSTWKLYENEIAKVTDNNPPNPWNNADAFAATALYLKDTLNSKTCTDYANQIPNQYQTLLERCAASQYYAGKRWYAYRFVYGEPVINKASQFQKDIEILNS